MSEWVVVGGGFAGLVGAYLLAKRGEQVTVVEQAPFVGGICWSEEWNGFYLDKGNRVFDNASDDTTEIILEIMRGDVHPVDLCYASITNRVKTEGIGQTPNLGSFGEAAVRDILAELLAAASAPTSATGSLHEGFVARFGPTAAGLLAKAVGKNYKAKSTELEPMSANMAPYQRIHFLDDATGSGLKQQALLDERIGISTAADPMRFYRDQARSYPHRCFYPNRHGMRGFCEAALQRLAELGVRVLTGVKIERIEDCGGAAEVVLAEGRKLRADKILWTSGLGPMNAQFNSRVGIGQFVHRVPMVLYYFAIRKDEEGPYHYVYDYDDEDMFHCAFLPGRYGRENCPEGFSYAGVEVPTTIGSPEWEQPQAFADRVWEEIRGYGLVGAARPAATHILKTPQSYMMPKLGFKDAITQFNRDLAVFPWLEYSDQLEFSVNSITRKLHATLDSGHNPA